MDLWMLRRMCLYIISINDVELSVVPAFSVSSSAPRARMTRANSADKRSVNVLPQTQRVSAVHLSASKGQENV